MFRQLACAGLAMALLSPTLQAQTRRDSVMSRLVRGLQMRTVLRAGTQPFLRGRVESKSGDTLAVRVSPDSIARLTIDDLATLEIYTRSGGAQILGQAFFAIGAAGGLGLYLSWCARNQYHCSKMDEDPDPYDDEEPTPTVVTFPLLTGVLLGALGYALAPPSWETVHLPVRVGVSPSRQGVLVYASLSTSLFSR